MTQPLIPIILFCLFSSSNLISQNTGKKYVDSLNNTAYRLKNSRNIKKMMLYTDSALTLSKELNYKKGEGHAYLNIGIAYYKKHQNDSALFALQKASIILESEYALHELALCMSFTGYIYQRLGNYEKSEKLFRREIEAFTELEQHFETSNSLSNLAVNYIIQGKYPEALKYSIEALEVRKRHNLNPSKEYQNIVVIYHKMKEYDKALTYLNEAVILNMNHQDTSGLIKAYNSIAVNYYGRSGKNYDSTKFYLEKSLKLAQKARFTRSQIVALGNIAEIYKEQLNFIKAKEYIYKALELQQKLNKNQHLFSLNTLAEIFLAEDKLDSSLFYSKEALTGALQVRDKSVERKSSEFISRIFEEKAEYDSALYYYKLSKSANDSIYNSEKAKMLSNLQIQLETLENEIEIQILTKEKAFSKYINYGLTIIILLIIVVAFFIFKTIKNRNKRKQVELELSKQILEQKVEHNKKELFNFTLNMINKNNSLMDVEEEVKSALSKNKPELNPTRILSKISIGKSSEKDWENFNKYFGAVHNDFFTKFKLNYPTLTSYELRLCALIKLHLSNREIAEILSIEQKSVKMACYRLKKKFELSESQKLSDFVVMQ